MKVDAVEAVFIWDYLGLLSNGKNGIWDRYAAASLTTAVVPTYATDKQQSQIEIVTECGLSLLLY